jgi:rhamnosyltransferase
VKSSAKGDPPAAVVLYNPDIELLEQLAAAISRDDRRIFVFVNGPIDSSAEQVLTSLSNANIVRSAQNVGLGAGLNALVEAAEGEGFDHILLFDQDSTPDSAMASRLLQRFVSLDRQSVPLAALGPRLIPPAEGNYVPVRYWRRRGRSAVPGAVDFLPTSGSLISIGAWRTIGPFRSDYFIGGIDVEWGYRCWASGFACILARDIVMIHRWGRAGVGAQIFREDAKRIYYYVRNAADGLGLPHMPLRWKVRQLATLFGQLVIVLISKRRARDSIRLFARAYRDGRQGKLGAAAPELFARQEAPT